MASDPLTPVDLSGGATTVASDPFSENQVRARTAKAKAVLAALGPQPVGANGPSSDGPSLLERYRQWSAAQKEADEVAVLKAELAELRRRLAAIEQKRAR